MKKLCMDLKNNFCTRINSPFNSIFSWTFPSPLLQVNVHLSLVPGFCRICQVDQWTFSFSVVLIGTPGVFQDFTVSHGWEKGKSDTISHSDLVVLGLLAVATLNFLVALQCWDLSSRPTLPRILEVVIWFGGCGWIVLSPSLRPSGSSAQKVPKCDLCRSNYWK